MNYIKVNCHIQKYDLERMSDYFFSLQCLGTELIESDFKQTIQEDKFGEIYTLNSEDYPDEGIILIGYFDEQVNPIELKLSIEKYVKKHRIKLCDPLIKIEKMAEVDYETSWRKDYHEIEINDHVVIVPSWFDEIEGKQTIKIEPGLGFGTGSHPTTFMCLRHVANYLKPQDSVCDLGTGSGIIAILAKKLGASRVCGIDLDPNALKNARENALLNQIDDIKWTNQPIDQLDDYFDIIITNIVFDVIIQLLPKINNCLKKNGLLIISGITKSQKDDIINKLVENDFQLIETEEMKDFVSFVLRK